MKLDSNKSFKKILDDTELENIVGGDDMCRSKMTYGEQSEVVISSIGTLGGMVAGSCVAYAWINSTMKRKDLNAWGKFWRGAVAVVLTTSIVGGTVNTAVARPVRMLVDSNT